jgi:hypothetical protein
MDYGRDLAPKRGKTPYVAVVSIEPSPSGDLMAVAAGNRKEQELDIILMSTKDGQVIRNLTGGFNKDKGYEYIATPGGFRNNACRDVGRRRRPSPTSARREVKDAHPPGVNEDQGGSSSSPLTARSPTSARTTRVAFGLKGRSATLREHRHRRGRTSP